MSEDFHPSDYPIETSMRDIDSKWATNLLSSALKVKITDEKMALKIVLNEVNAYSDKHTDVPTTAQLFEWIAHGKGTTRNVLSHHTAAFSNPRKVNKKKADGFSPPVVGVIIRNLRIYGVEGPSRKLYKRMAMKRCKS